MKWLLLLLGLALIVAAGAGLVASIDLLTTEIGATYATWSAVAFGTGLILLAVAALAHRVDALSATIMRYGENARRAAAELDLAPPIPPQAAIGDEASAAAAEAYPPLFPSEAETGAPPLAAEAAPLEAEGRAAPPTTLVGRYSSGGANYSIFSDGSIEAETDQGAFRFASMSEFKAFIVARRASA